MRKRQNLGIEGNSDTRTSEKACQGHIPDTGTLQPGESGYQNPSAGYLEPFARSSMPVTFTIQLKDRTLSKADYERLPYRWDTNKGHWVKP